MNLNSEQSEFASNTFCGLLKAMQILGSIPICFANLRDPFGHKHTQVLKCQEVKTDNIDKSFKMESFKVFQVSDVELLSNLCLCRRRSFTRFRGAGAFSVSLSISFFRYRIANRFVAKRRPTTGQHFWDQSPWAFAKKWKEMTKRLQWGARFFQCQNVIERIFVCRSLTGYLCLEPKEQINNLTQIK